MDHDDSNLAEGPSGEGCLGAPPCEQRVRRERRDAAERRQRILTVARELFGAQGVEATSMHEIARGAGVGQGTLYRRYAHKGELCTALLDENTSRLFADIERSLADSERPALDRLADLLDRLAAFTEANGPLMGAIGDAACGSRRGEFYSSPFYQGLHQATGALLGSAVERGETAPLDIGPTTDAVLATLASDLYLHQRYTLGYPREQILAALRRMLFEGLRARPDS
ncbi:MAG TPA: TetR/AcrR family transcriptional regulator [Roseiflexaceae bacterium]|nr:TetR/AcrR family transcriptional regulator [Roseiflexaceae bacterium]